MNSCPFCGGTSGYYENCRVSGVVRDITTWEGEKENTEMHDSVNYKTIHKYYKCLDCNKNLKMLGEIK